MSKFTKFSYADMPLWALRDHSERLALYWCAKRWIVFRLLLICAVEKPALRAALARVAVWIYSSRRYLWALDCEEPFLSLGLHGDLVHRVYRITWDRKKREWRKAIPLKDRLVDTIWGVYDSKAGWTPAMGFWVEEPF